MAQKQLLREAGRGKLKRAGLLLPLNLLRGRGRQTKHGLWLFMWPEQGMAQRLLQWEVVAPTSPSSHLRETEARSGDGRIEQQLGGTKSQKRCGRWARAGTPRWPYRQPTRTGCSYGRWLFFEAAGAGNHPATGERQRETLRTDKKIPAPRLRREEQRPARGTEPSPSEGARPRCGRRGQRCGRARLRSPFPLLPARVASSPLLLSPLAGSALAPSPFKVAPRDARRAGAAAGGPRRSPHPRLGVALNRLRAARSRIPGAV